MRPYIAALLSGPLISAGFLEPALHPLAWISFVPFLWALSQAKTKGQAVVMGACAGYLTNLFGFYWLVYTMHVFGSFPVPIAAVFYGFLTAYSTLQFILFALAVHRCGFGPLGLFAAIVWTALEFVYPNIFMWRMANTQFHLPVLLQIGDLGGPFPLSLAIVWVNAGLVLLLFQKPRRYAPLLAALTLVAAIVAYGLVRMPQIEGALRASPPLKVGLVQGNVSIEHKGNSAYFDINIERYRALSREVQDKVDLLIWPETVSQEWIEADSTVIPPKAHPLPDLRTHLVYGGLSYRYTDSGEPEMFNSAFLLGPHGELLGRYDKHILLPFGEYLPGSRFLPFIKDISPHSGDFTPGRESTIFHLGDVPIGPMICYEDVVIGIPRETTRAGAGILFNILNDAWFGESAGPYEHQALALWRAVENRRYLLRSSNSGVTSIIDPFGRVVDQLGTFREGVLIGEVRPLAVESFYTRFGDVVGWGLVAVALAGVITAGAWRGGVVRRDA